MHSGDRRFRGLYGFHRSLAEKARYQCELKDSERRIHRKARSQEAIGYPERLQVSDDCVSWDTEFESSNPQTAREYDPRCWTHPSVGKADPSKVDHKDPTQVQGLWLRITYTSLDQGEPLEFEYNGTPLSELVGREHDGPCAGAPKNPIGRTGLRGRGAFFKWGPNQAADPIVMRVHPSKRDAPASARLQLLAWKRPDTQEWSIPGGILLDGEDDKEAVLRILSNRLGNMAANSLARLLGDEADISDNIFYRGYSDDPRNTDNAWTETTAYRFMNTNNLPFIEENACDAAWIDMDMDDARFRNLYGFHRKLSMKAMEEEEARRTRRITSRSSTSTRVSVSATRGARRARVGERGEPLSLPKRYSQCLAISKLNSEGSTFADEMTPRRPLGR